MSDSLNAHLVKDFVYNAHGDLDKVKEMLEREPGLVNASWDWGNGDWETALGAAAHVGRRDIALYLLEKGARIDLFAAAMLGRLEIVKAIVQDDPSVIHSRGPHTIPLIAHAKAGKEHAAEVVRFLESVQQP
ncbi:MAG: ankyrin repeat protein [Paenibacillus sp.]|jgi:hypothetical protein|nr:ankyrin repeat protein [Paenibacillus sp.]